MSKPLNLRLECKDFSDQLSGWVVVYLYWDYEALSDYEITIRWGDGKTTKKTFHTFEPPSVVPHYDHIYKCTGSYKIRATVRDVTPGKSEEERGCGEASCIVWTYAHPEITKCKVSPEVGTAPLKVTLNVGWRKCTGKPPFELHVNWGDGSPGTVITTSGYSVSLTHTYTNKGTFPINVRLYDSYKWTKKWKVLGSSCATVVLPLSDVKVKPPKKRLYVGWKLAFVVYWKNGAPPYTVEIDYGDGTKDKYVSRADYRQAERGLFHTFMHVYDKAGTYKVTATVTDGLGKTLQSSSKITVKERVPPETPHPPPEAPHPPETKRITVKVRVSGGEPPYMVEGYIKWNGNRENFSRRATSAGTYVVWSGDVEAGETGTVYAELTDSKGRKAHDMKRFST